MKSLNRWWLLLAALAAAPAGAHAPGHGEPSLATGLLHPLTGLDHILSALIVGLLAVSAARRWSEIMTGALLMALIASVMVSLPSAAGAAGYLIGLLTATGLLCLSGALTGRLLLSCGQHSAALWERLLWKWAEVCGSGFSRDQGTRPTTRQGLE